MITCTPYPAPPASPVTAAVWSSYLESPFQPLYLTESTFTFYHQSS